MGVQEGHALDSIFLVLSTSLGGEERAMMMMRVMGLVLVERANGEDGREGRGLDAVEEGLLKSVQSVPYDS